MEKGLKPMDFKNSGISKYKSNGVLTRTPELLILDLYDGAVRFMTQALEGFEKESYEDIHNNLSRAGAIIDELMSCLNFEKGGEIAKNFFNLYVFIRERITTSLVKKDKVAAEQALKIITMMRDTWSEGVVKDRV